MSRRKFNKEELEKLAEFYRSRIRRIVPIEGCKQCGHNAAFVISAHPLGQLVKCTSCRYFQMKKESK